MINKVTNLIRQLVGPKYRDAINDPRHPIEKEKDYKFDEDIRLPQARIGHRVTKLSFTPFNQEQTGACGAFSAAHMRLIHESEPAWGIPWYRLRSNFSQPGMFLKEVLALAAKATAVTPPENSKIPTDVEANRMPAQPLLWVNDRKQRFQYVQTNPYDADAIWRAVGNGLPVVFAFYSTINEWVEEMIEREFTTLMTSPVRHYVVALPHSNHFKDGRAWVSVVDSSPQFGYYLRQVSMDFIRARGYLGGGFYIPYTPKKKKVTVVPVAPVRFGQRGENVRKLQQFLTEVGLMIPLHQTGFYGNITSAAVLRWQLDNIKSTNPLELERLAGRFWGPASIRTVKELYA